MVSALHGNSLGIGSTLLTVVEGIASAVGVGIVLAYYKEEHIETQHVLK